MYGYRKSGSIRAIKWLSMILLILGLMAFIFSIVLFAIDFNHKKTTAVLATLPGFIMSIVAIGAGVAGASVGVYEGQIHNISGKNVALALNVVTFFSAIMYMGIVGTYFFYQLNDFPLSGSTSTYKALFGVFLAIFVFAFFILIVSIIITVIAALWIPREHDGPSPYSSERNMMDEPYIVHEERIPYSKPAFGRKYASSDGFYGGRPAIRY